MILLAFSLRQLRRHWRLNMVLLASMMMGVGVLASSIMLGTAIAGDNLDLLLRNATVADRNLAITGTSETDELPAEIAGSVEPLARETVAVRDAIVEAQSVIIHAGGEREDLLPVIMSLDFYSFDRLEERATLKEGRWPETTTSTVDPVLEAAIGVETAAQTGLSIGDELVSTDERHRARVVGIVTPNDPESEVWWGDSQLLPFTMWRRIQFNPDLVEYNVALLLTPQTMSTQVTSAVTWRVILDPQRITVANGESVRQLISAMQARLTGQGFIVETNLIALLDTYQDQLAQARVSLLLLTAQSSLAVLYLLNILGGFLVERSRMELSTMRGRGFSRLQLTSVYAVTLGLLAVVAWLIAPFITQQLLGLWARWWGGSDPRIIPAEAWWLALVAVLAGWTTLVISIFQAIRYELSIGDRQRGLSQDIRQGRRRFLFDIFLLALGGGTYWQLTQTGSFTRAGESGAATGILGTADPVLLLGPSLLLIAAGLIFLRLFPHLLRLAAWISRRKRGLIWPLGLTRLVRQPAGANRMTLLISVTAGLIFFAAIFSHSLITWQEATARYVVGADIRMRRPFAITQERPAQSVPEGAAGTEIFRSKALFELNEFQRFPVDMMAVDPSTFSRVASFPPGISPFQMRDIMRVLEPGQNGVLPVVISENAITRHLNRGDRITYKIGFDDIDFEVTGIIGDFPLLTEPFAITNRALLVSRLEARGLDMTSPTLIGQIEEEQWFAVEAGQHEMVLDQLAEEVDLVVGDARAKLQEFQADHISRITTAAFRLNAAVLLLLSGVGFVLVQLFTMRQRKSEFDVLRAMGLSRRQIWRLIQLEGGFLIATGLAVGGAIGYGLAVMMRPFLSQMLASSFGGIMMNRIVIHWPTVALLFVALTSFYGVALLLLLVNSARK